MAMPNAAPPTGAPVLAAELATTAQQVLESQALRYRVFAREMGAHCPAQESALDNDAVDRFCHHLLVRNRQTGEVVASTRILTDTQSRLKGGFDCESTFDFSNILTRPARIIEIGRTCVARNARHGPAIGVLWLALARFMIIHRVDYMIGCVSLSLSQGLSRAQSIASRALQCQGAPETLLAYPHVGLPSSTSPGLEADIPPLLDAHLRLGVWVCGEPALNHTRHLVDVPVLLDIDHLDSQYRHHFLHHRLQLSFQACLPTDPRTVPDAYGETTH